MPKKIHKKARNIIKREIIYCYNAPNNNTKLSIESNFKNTIIPTFVYNNNLNINNELRNKSRYINKASDIRKMSSSTINTNTTNTSRANLFNLNINPRIKNNENQEENHYEKHRTYKTKTVTPASLIQTETEPIKQDFISIRRKYTNSQSNKNLLIESSDNSNYKYNRFTAGSPGYNLELSNNSSKDNIIKSNHSSAYIGRKQKINFISPKRNEVLNNETKNGINNNQNKRNNNMIIRRNNPDLSKYEQYNKNCFIKSENRNDEKSHTYFLNKNLIKREIPRTPISKEYNNNFYKPEYTGSNNKTKSLTMAIITNKQEPKNKSRTYISSKGLNQNSIKKKKNEKTDNQSQSNDYRIYVNTTQIKKNNNNEPIQNKTKSKYKSTVYFSSNLEEDKKSENTKFKNNKEYLDSKWSSLNLNKEKDKDIKLDIKTNTYKNNLISSGHTLLSSKNYEKLDIKSTPNFLNKTFNYANSSANKDTNNINFSEKSQKIKTFEINNIDDKYDDKNNNKNEENIQKINDEKIEDKIEDKNEEKNDDKKDENIINNKMDDNIDDVNNNQKDEEIRNKIDNTNNTNNEENLINGNNLLTNDKSLFNFDNLPNTNTNYLNYSNAVDNKIIFNKYNIKQSAQISDFSKTYLSSFNPTATTTRPALSDISKQFLISENLSHKYIKPELSNITRAYLSSQSPVNLNDENK